MKKIRVEVIEDGKVLKSMTFDYPEKEVTDYRSFGIEAISEPPPIFGDVQPKSKMMIGGTGDWDDDL